MAQEVFQRTKPHINVEIIGHIDHGKTTTTGAILAIQTEKGLAKLKSYADIAKGAAVRDETKTVTVAVSRVEHEMAIQHYSHIDCPGHADYIKNMIADAAHMDGAILVVSAANGPMPQTCAHIVLAPRINVPALVVFLNKCDPVGDKELLEQVELEIRDLMNKCEFPGHTVSIVRGNAKEALDNLKDPKFSRCIGEVRNAMDKDIREPKRQRDKRFLMAIEDVLSISGRGNVVTGRIERSVVEVVVKVHEKDPVVGLFPTQDSVYAGVEMFNKLLDEGQAGDNVGILLRDVDKDAVTRGQVLAGPISINPHTKFECNVYTLRAEERSRHTQFLSEDKPQFYFRTTDVMRAAYLHDGAEMCISGDTILLDVTFGKPIAIQDNGRFAKLGSLSQIQRIVGVVTEFGSVIDSTEQLKSIKATQGSGQMNSKKQERIRIRMEAYDHSILVQSASEVVDTAKRSGAIIHGAIPLPSRIEKYTVLRSPNIGKTSREQFEIRTHKRVIDLIQPRGKTFDALNKLSLPAGVNVKIKAARIQNMDPSRAPNLDVMPKRICDSDQAVSGTENKVDRQGYRFKKQVRQFLEQWRRTRSTEHFDALLAVDSVNDFVLPENGKDVAPVETAD